MVVRENVSIEADRSPFRYVEASSYFAMAKKWLQVCQKEHSQTCPSGSLPDLLRDSLKVIDWLEESIVSLPDNAVYIALSYVWGPQPSTVSRPKGFQHQAYESSRLPSDTPLVVRDSSKVTIALGRRYLWVDRYCIDQSNAEEQAHQIRNMSHIYQAAEVTIVAAAGADADHELPGVSVCPRVQARRACLPKFNLISLLPRAEEGIEDSKWATRAWTYQEGLLSRRRLFFTSHEMCFECATMHSRESCVLHIARGFGLFDFMYQPAMFRPSIDPLESFWDSVQQYSSRALSNPVDSLNALLGYCQLFQPLLLLWVQARSLTFGVFHFISQISAGPVPNKTQAPCLQWH